MNDTFSKMANECEKLKEKVYEKLMSTDGATESEVVNTVSNGDLVDGKLMNGSDDIVKIIDNFEGSEVDPPTQQGHLGADMDATEGNNVIGETVDENDIVLEIDSENSNLSQHESTQAKTGDVNLDVSGKNNPEHSVNTIPTEQNTCTSLNMEENEKLVPVAKNNADINGNDATQEDQNLSKQNGGLETGADTKDFKKDATTPTKRKRPTPSNLPLLETVRSNGRQSPGSPTQKIGSPTQKTASPTQKYGFAKKPPSPMSLRKNENGSEAKSPQSPKFTLKRKGSKSKLPVSTPQSPDVSRAKNASSPTKTDDTSILMKIPPSPVDNDDASSVASSAPSVASVISVASSAASIGSSLASFGSSAASVASAALSIASSATSVASSTQSVASVAASPACTPIKKGKVTTSTPIKDPKTSNQPVPATPTTNISPQVQTPQTALQTATPSARDRLQKEKETWQETVKQFQQLKMAMAEVGMDPKSRFLRCLFCTNLFSQNGREPRMLACCLNAICSACASKLHLDGPCHLRCPVCRQSISLPQDRTNDSIDLTDESVIDGGQLDLPLETLRNKIIEFQHIQKGLSYPCTCTSKAMCTWFCENCDSYMCDTCRDSHKDDVKTKRHSTIAIVSLKSRQMKDFKHHHYCKEHNYSKVTLYCTTCRQVICSTCTRDGHEKDTHTVITIQEAFGTRIKQTSKLISKAKKKHRKLTDYSKSLKAKSNSSDISANSAKEAINETFDRLIDALQTRRTELLHEVDREASSLDTSATVDTDSADCRLSMLSTASDYTKEFTAKTDIVEFLQLYSTVTDTLKHVMDFTMDSVNTSRQGVAFSPWNLQLVEKLVKSAGQLRVVTYKPTGRPGRDEVSLKPALNPEGDDLNTTTTIADQTQDTATRDVVCSPENRVIMIPGNEDRGMIPISCPRLEFDMQTVHQDRTLSLDGAMINHAPERPLTNTGCRLRAYPGAMANTALDGTGFNLWIVKTKVAVKQRVPDNKMLFEAALTGSPVDAPLSQRIDSSLVLAGCDLHHELCVKVKYCCKNLAHLTGCKNAAGTHAEFKYGMLLDFDKRRLHVLDLTSNTVISRADRIAVHKPLWTMFCVGRFTYADVKMTLDTADKVKVTPDMFKLLNKVIDQERAPK